MISDVRGLMQQQAPTKEAQAQGLTGSDTFKYSDLLYYSPFHRDHGVVRLNIEALRAFGDTILIARRKELDQERRVVVDWLENREVESGLDFPRCPISIDYMHSINLEHFKIACGFELHLKARLLARDFVVHEIDPKTSGLQELAKSQRLRPISRTELFKVTDYFFSGKVNYLPGLKQRSVLFSWLTEKPAYVEVMDLPSQLVEMIDEFRQLRNQIHLPGDVLETPKISAVQAPLFNVMTNFLNTEVIERSNSLIDVHKMPYPKLEFLK